MNQNLIHFCFTTGKTNPGLMFTPDGLADFDFVSGVREGILLAEEEIRTSGTILADYLNELITLSPIGPYTSAEALSYLERVFVCCCYENFLMGSSCSSPLPIGRSLVIYAAELTLSSLLSGLFSRKSEIDITEWVAKAEFINNLYLRAVTFLKQPQKRIIEEVENRKNYLRNSTRFEGTLDL